MRITWDNKEVLQTLLYTVLQKKHANILLKLYQYIGMLLLKLHILLTLALIRENSFDPFGFVPLVTLRFEIS